ncbi:MAG: hypothetical protein AAB198_06040 [Actinomycetota bacterium]
MTTVLGAVTLVLAACGGGTGTSNTNAGSSTTAGPFGSSTTVGDDTTTSAGASTTGAETTTTTGAGGALTDNGDGSYVIDWSALQGAIFFAPPGGGSDPFFFVHTDPAVDGFFFSVEAYTVFGTAWTGQLGTFIVDCRSAGTGICVHFDPDGPGPVGDLGADFLPTGDVEIIQADAEGFEAVFSNVIFTDGSTIPGPFTVTG